MTYWPFWKRGSVSSAFITLFSNWGRRTRDLSAALTDAIVIVLKKKKRVINKKNIQLKKDRRKDGMGLYRSTAKLSGATFG